MAVTRAEADQAFSYALNRVRAVGTDAAGRSRVAETELVREVWGRFNGTGSMVHADAVNAVKRAIKAREGGLILTNDPLNPSALLAKGYANKPVLDRRRGDYEYRVVVKGEGNGREFETLVIIRSRLRLTGQQVIDRAELNFAENAGLHRDYRNRISALGPNMEQQAWIVSASRHSGD